MVGCATPPCSPQEGSTDAVKPSDRARGGPNANTRSYGHEIAAAAMVASLAQSVELGGALSSSRRCLISSRAMPCCLARCRPLLAGIRQVLLSHAGLSHFLSRMLCYSTRT
jgi:hypothetical protein